MQGLFSSSALEKDILDRVISGYDTQLTEICSMPEVKGILDNPVIRPSRKDRTFFTACLQMRILDQLSISLIDLVVNNGREALPAIASQGYLST
ncbi:MAG: hypothetical protein MZV63_31690 [Marinilabiliales bacterium]|nr:hypothetical protein [Marinilabiliales bacterium]